MGKKGSKMSADAQIEAEEVVGILSTIGEISSRKMFGGFGIFEESKMFGIVDSSGNLFLKADDSNLSEFEAAGSEKHGKMPYYSVPEEVRNNQEKLCKLAKGSINVAHK